VPFAAPGMHTAAGLNVDSTGYPHGEQIPPQQSTSQFKQDITMCLLLAGVTGELPSIVVFATTFTARLVAIINSLVCHHLHWHWSIPCAWHAHGGALGRLCQVRPGQCGGWQQGAVSPRRRCARCAVRSALLLRYYCVRVCAISVGLQA
jgi:hypothetical protein